MQTHEMDFNIVTLSYDPEKWAQAQSSPSPNSPARFVTLNYKKETSSPTPVPLTTTIPMRSRTGTDNEELSVETPIPKSLQRLLNYTNEMSQAGANPEAIDRQWYEDLTNVGQRLRLLRDTFKVLQAVRKKRALGERVDFRAMNDVRVSSTGSPSILEDELGNGHDSDHVPAPAPTVSRRGRPRKRGIRGRKSMLSRGDRTPPVSATLVRSRTSRRLQEATQTSETNKDSTENLRASLPADSSVYSPQTNFVKTEQSSHDFTSSVPPEPNQAYAHFAHSGQLSAEPDGLGGPSAIDSTDVHELLPQQNFPGYPNREAILHALARANEMRENEPYEPDRPAPTLLPTNVSNTLSQLTVSIIENLKRKNLYQDTDQWQEQTGSAEDIKNEEEAQ